MKRTILTILFAAVLTFVFSLGFYACKKEAPGPDQTVEEEKKVEEKAPEAKKEEEKK